MVMVVVMVVVVRPREDLGSDGRARGERREKLHPFESHPRTPTGLKKSIKRREARHGEGDSRGRRVERG